MKTHHRGRVPAIPSKLTLEARAERLQPLQRAFGRMREGIATIADWCTLAGACSLALAIEHYGGVTGLREHLQGTDTALGEIRRRANQDEGAYPYALHLEEIERLRTFIDLHAHQLAEITTAGLSDARRVATPVRLHRRTVVAMPAMRQEALPL